jgi:hypothetical protein
MTRAFDWTFRSRDTGAITIAQFPNVSLGLFIIAVLARAVFSPSGHVRTGIDAVATAALVWWAADEILRGVNPWRRFLGAAALAVAVLDLVR